MGLALAVGIVAELAGKDPEGAAAYGDEFRELADQLVARGIARHVEPAVLPADAIQSWDMGSYSCIHHLRLVAAHVAIEGTVPSPLDEPTEHPVVRRYYAAMQPTWWQRVRGRKWLAFEHLMNHSDAEGYYLPLDFEHVVVLDAQQPPQFVGSSLRLRDDCRALAGLLEIPAEITVDRLGELEPLPRTEAGPRWRHHLIAAHACVTLLDAAEASIRHGAALAFC